MVYVSNALDERLDLDLVQFSLLVGEYLTKKANIPCIKKTGSGMFFRKTKALKDAISEAPMWVRILTREEAKTID